MSATISTTSCASNSVENTEKVEPIVFQYSEVQKKIAEKAIKLDNENNPIVAHKFTADPAVLVYNDTIYIYGTNDSQQLEYTLGEEDNGYNRINTLNVFSSKDMRNWTDCGEIKVGGSSGAAKWARNSWAPAIAMKNIDGKDKFFLYFADSANGIGVLTADSPTGPFTDPLGHALITRSMPNMNGVYWLFDPAVFVDDDGTGYIYFGGGVDKDVEHPKSSRCAKLGDDMISLAERPVEIDAPFVFEDSGINKVGNKYYYSYCSNWSSRDGAVGPHIPGVASICYMSSDSPLGPFKYEGETLLNPGKYFGPWGNNHHWIFQMNGKWYIAYHCQTMEKKVGFTKGGYRNLYLNEFAVNEDGFWPEQGRQNITNAGPAQLKAFNPYETVKAATLRSSKDVVVTSEKVISIKDRAFLRLDGVDFSKGAEKITVKAAAKGEGSIAVYLDSNTKGTLIGEVAVNGEGTFEAALNYPETAEKLHNLYFVFSGEVAMEEWKIN